LAITIGGEKFQTEAIFALAGNFAIFTDNFPRFADNTDI